MRNAISLFSILIVCFSCAQQEQTTHADNTIISEKYRRITKHIQDFDSSVINEWKAKYLQLKSIYEYTFEDAGKTCNNIAGVALSNIRTVDTTGERNGSFYPDLLLFCELHKVLFSNNKEIIDPDNKHILAYLSTDKSSQLLTVLNMDEDNRALVADFDFPNLELLLYNYDVYLSPPPLKSLLLRPFEARVYKIR